MQTRRAVALAIAVPVTAAPAWAQDTPVKSLGVVTITGSQPTSLPTQIPTTMESIDRQQPDASVNATDSEDALKDFPSLLVRKRHAGDYAFGIDNVNNRTDWNFHPYPQRTWFAELRADL